VLGDRERDERQGKPWIAGSIEEKRWINRDVGEGRNVAGTFLGTNGGNGKEKKGVFSDTTSQQQKKR